eukprot:13944092-Alexandrium_andersonii.AAC.1
MMVAVTFHERYMDNDTSLIFVDQFGEGVPVTGRSAQPKLQAKKKSVGEATKKADDQLRQS